MAGSGDLGVMRTCRMLRARVHNNNTVTYGSHMAVHLALGLLFLGGGKFGLSNSPEAVAAMICAFYPKFPTHSSDNRYHLQALRHLYVLAVEPRVLVARSSDTGSIVRCGVELQYSDTVHYRGVRLEMTSPVLLPSLSLLSSVAISDQTYWSTVFRNIDNEGWRSLVNILNSGGDLAVKRKSGGGLSQSLQWSLGSDHLSKLTSLPQVNTFLSSYLTGCPDHWTNTVQSLMATCHANATPDLVPALTSVMSRDTGDSGQVSAQIQTIISLSRRASAPVLQPELVLSLAQKTHKIMDQLHKKTTMKNVFRQFVRSNKNMMMGQDQKQLISSTLNLHAMPAQYEIRDDNQNPLKLFKHLKKSSNPASFYRLTM